MKKIVLSVILFAVIAQTASARDPQEIVDIRTRYQFIGDAIRMNLLYVVEVVRNRTDVPTPGTGHDVTTIRFYYDDTDEETSELTDRLVKIEQTQEIAAMKLYTEYVFGANGKLIFIYNVTDNIMNNEPPTLETRFYFSSTGGLIRVLSGTEQMDINDSEYRQMSYELLEELHYLCELAEVAN